MSVESRCKFPPQQSARSCRLDFVQFKPQSVNKVAPPPSSLYGVCITHTEQDIHSTQEQSLASQSNPIRRGRHATSFGSTRTICVPALRHATSPLTICTPPAPDARSTNANQWKDSLVLLYAISSSSDPSRNAEHENVNRYLQRGDSSFRTPSS